MRGSILLLCALGNAGCVSWQPLASVQPLACAADEIVVSKARSGALTDRWQASCRGFTYECSAPAGIDDTTPATCTLLRDDRPVAVTPLL